ncbi:hypothetical protein NMY22_g11122 [Coprinellus aureogranulatus]|nr:hypothetical protein NMY22_g11122 [Coprinellus aureogranulatus]
MPLSTPPLPPTNADMLDPKNLDTPASFGGVAGLHWGLGTNSERGLSTSAVGTSGSSSPESTEKEKAGHSDSHTVEADTQGAEEDRVPEIMLTAPSGDTTTVTPQADPNASKASLTDRKWVYGENVLPTRSSKTLLQLMWMALKDKVLVLLCIAVVISLALGLFQDFGTPRHSDEPVVDWVEEVATMIAVGLVVIVGSVNDWQKERQFKVLNEEKEERGVKVIRDGVEKVIDVKQVVVGDIALVEPGEILPCDVFLAGASDAIKKVTFKVVVELYRNAQNEGKDPHILHVDCFMVGGALRGDTENTPLQLKLNALAEPITKIGSIAGLLLFAALMIRFSVQLGTGEPPQRTAAEKGIAFVNILITSVTLVVVVVPEGLPLAVTLALAFATKPNARLWVLLSSSPTSSTGSTRRVPAGSYRSIAIATLLSTRGELQGPKRSWSNEVETKPIDELARDNISRTIIFYANQTLRTIALCYFPSWSPPDVKPNEENEIDYEHLSQDMTLIAITGIEDPLRLGITDTVAKCHRADVTVKMCTGDNVLTARSIAAQCGIFTPGGLIMEDPIFMKLSNQDCLEIVPRLRVLARHRKIRRSPSRRSSLSVKFGATGDSTNNGPSLKTANVGFSMGIASTEVAEEAFDIILRDDSFTSFLQISTNGTDVVITFVSVVALVREEFVMSAVQLLWINIIMDTFAALALATDPATEPLLDRKPDRKTAPLFSVDMYNMTLAQLVSQIIVILLFHFKGLDWPNLPHTFEGERTLKTLVLNAFVFAQIFNSVDCRHLDNKLDIFEGITKNRYFIVITLIEIGIQILIDFVGNAAFTLFDFLALFGKPESDLPTESPAREGWGGAIALVQDNLGTFANIRGCSGWFAQGEYEAIAWATCAWRVEAMRPSKSVVNPNSNSNHHQPPHSSPRGRGCSLFYPGRLSKIRVESSQDVVLGNYLVVGSWDNSDVIKILSGGADNAGRTFNVTTGQATQVAQRDAPIKVVGWVDAPGTGILATGSWDKAIKYWDLRTPNPVALVTLPGRCYTFDIQYPLMVVGTAERHIQIFNLTNSGTAFQGHYFSPESSRASLPRKPVASQLEVWKDESPFNMLTTRTLGENNFSFKCHHRDAVPNSKDQALVFAVNVVSFHPVNGTFPTCAFDAAPGPITTTSFNRTGLLFAYGSLYDWSKGHSAPGGKEKAKGEKADLERKLSELGIEVPLVDVEIEFIGASWLADPHFVAKLDDKITFVSDIIRTHLSPVWNKVWRVRNVPATASLKVEIMVKTSLEFAGILNIIFSVFDEVCDDLRGQKHLLRVPAQIQDPQKANVHGGD